MERPLPRLLPPTDLRGHPLAGQHGGHYGGHVELDDPDDHG